MLNMQLQIQVGSGIVYTWLYYYGHHNDNYSQHNILSSDGTFEQMDNKSDFVSMQEAIKQYLFIPKSICNNSQPASL